MKRKNHSSLILLMMAAVFLLMVVLYSTIFSPTTTAALKSDAGQMGKPLYKLDIAWPKYTEYFTGQVFGVAVDHIEGLVYVAQRGENVPKVLVFSTDGDFLQAWNTSTLEEPHGIFLANATANPTVWITDVGKGAYGHTIKQYSPSGKLLQVLGTPGKPGSNLNPLQFDQPAEIFVHSSGEIYIVDGDGGMNNRLIKLSKDLQVLWMHGEKGQGLAQFNIPHSVAVDYYQRVWVADRGNKRIQVFNSVTGDWLGSWGSCFDDDAPYSVRLTADQKYFVVAQLNTNQVSLLEAPPVGGIGQCRVTSVIQLAEDIKPHLVDVDLKTGALYVAEIGGQQAQKFIPLTRGSSFL
ncbi:NHL repeat-containing protein 3-like isoform X2 [Denticeps clupeoides]|uniref:NHL repeat-containing protein 3-like isoform X2 n=1 Tax=Denticeps clupeoides TaxID=299321 RepID=UPI0010A3ECED|nr:NHL repeat-containing protein 3-like isoform X2 [Denticeps clupeoides]